MQSSKLLDHHLKGGNACSSVINMHLFTRGARTALLPHSDLSASQPAGRLVVNEGRFSQQEVEHLTEAALQLRGLALHHHQFPPQRLDLALLAGYFVVQEGTFVID